MAGVPVGPHQDVAVRTRIFWVDVFWKEIFFDLNKMSLRLPSLLIEEKWDMGPGVCLSCNWFCVCSFLFQFSLELKFCSKEDKFSVEDVGKESSSSCFNFCKDFLPEWIAVDDRESSFLRVFNNFSSSNLIRFWQLVV